jgi:hypothetical protein
MAVSLGRKIRRIGLMPGKAKDPSITPERKEEIISELRTEAKRKRQRIKR